MKTAVLLILFFLNAMGGSTQPIELTKDLKNSWKVLKGNVLEDYQGERIHSIHFFVTEEYKGGTISITAPEEFTLFVDGELQIRAGSELRINVDSLLSVKGYSPLLSVFNKDNVKTIKTELIQLRPLDNLNFVRASDHLNDFIIISSLLLFGFFIVLFRFNTRLTIDYFNLSKVLSFQEREDAIFTGRIGSSVNVLFFVFISMFIGLLLLVIFNSGPTAVQKISIQSTSAAFIWWFFFSVMVLGFLVVKLMLVYIMSALFGFKSMVRFQFFNFIRSLYVTAALMGIGLLGYFVFELEKPDFFYFLLAAACGFMILSSFFFYLKLMSKTSSAGFHLFSYLCGSEIILMVILIKVLFN